MKSLKAIVNGKIVLADRILTGKAVIFDEKIRDITDEKNVPIGMEVIDAAGEYIFPGLIDVHIHGFLGEDTSVCDASGVKKMSEGLVRFGVTGWLPTTVTLPVDVLEGVAAMIREVMPASKDWDGSVVLGMNAEGPFLNPKKKGAHVEEDITKPCSQVIIDNADVIKITTIAPEMDEGFVEIKKIVNGSDVIVSLGHSDATYELACDAINAGVKQITHLFNAMSALGHRNPGVVGAAFNTNAYTELIADTFHIHPALFSVVAKIKKDRLILITDCLQPGGLSDGEYALGTQKIYLKGIECRLGDGTIAGSVLTLNKGVKNLLAHTELSIPEAVACASLHPARALGIDKAKGSIELGKDADIFIADKEFNVKKTIIGGIIKYDCNTKN